MHKNETMFHLKRTEINKRQCKVLSGNVEKTAAYKLDLSGLFVR